MSQFSAGITALNSESKFAKAYSDGVHKASYWEVNYLLLKSVNFLVMLVLLETMFCHPFTFKL